MIGPSILGSCRRQVFGSFKGNPGASMVYSTIFRIILERAVMAALRVVWRTSVRLFTLAVSWYRRR